MRCLACDSSLSVAAAKARMPVSGEYWQLCRACMDSIRFQVDPKDAEVWREDRRRDGTLPKAHCL